MIDNEYLTNLIVMKTITNIDIYSLYSGHDVDKFIIYIY